MLKRMIDLTISVPAIVLLSPVFFLCAVLVRVTSPGPAIFKDKRLGRHGLPFDIWKFRTMVKDAPRLERRDSEGAHVIPPDDPRITSVGRILRTTSLDELPQLFNVVRGEMSLVGPRPDEARAIALYTGEETRKLEMKPGITSLAMIHGRNSIPWRERIQWELRYVDGYSLRLDCFILLKTIPVVLMRRGIFTSDKNDKRGGSR